eukprot:13526321-Ditylum_brightwellii.AAC.2
MSDGFKCIAQSHCYLAVVEQRNTFSLCCQADHMLDHAAFDEDGGIVRCFVIVEGMWASCTAKIASKLTLCAIENKIRHI